MLAAVALSDFRIAGANDSGHRRGRSLYFVTAAQISKLPHLTVAVQIHDRPTQFEGVPLSSVLSLAGILLGDALRGPRMSDVLVEGAVHGNKVAFALPETDPAFATREIILADMRDGKPPDTMEGPLRVVAPVDKRPARWVRQVSSRELLRQSEVIWRNGGVYGLATPGKFNRLSSLVYGIVQSLVACRFVCPL